MHGQVRLKKAPAKSDSVDDSPPLIRSVDMMGGFAKGLSVIEAFSRDQPLLTIAEIAKRTGLDRAATRRCLLTLVEKSYVTAQGRHFSLSPKILRLAHTFLGQSLQIVSQPTLEGLAKEFDETCSACALDGTRIVYRARSALRHPLTMRLNVGSHLPAYCTAAGRVLLAALPQPEARQLLQQTKRLPLTEHTITDVDKLVDELANVRGNGYAVIDEELEVGACSIAVPLFNVSGSVVGSLVVGSLLSRKSVSRLKTDVLPRLRDAQAYLAQILV
jgi:IclR family pca regulon transcriptional regulator